MKRLHLLDADAGVFYNKIRIMQREGIPCPYKLSETI